MKKPLVIVLSIIGVVLLITLGIFIYFKITYLSKEEVKEIVIRDTDVDRDNIHFSSIDLDTEENLYEVEFYYITQNAEYEYKINAKNGRIIYSDFNLPKNNEKTENQTNSNNQNSNSSTNEITLDEAKKIALENDGISLEQSNITFTKTNTDYEHGKKIYEIEFIYNQHEYNYEIDATNGEIISYEKDHR